MARIQTDIISLIQSRWFTWVAILVAASTFAIYSFSSKYFTDIFPQDIWTVVAIASQSGALLFQLVSIQHLICRIDAFRNGSPPISSNQGNLNIYTSLKNKIFRAIPYALFVSVTISPFIVFEVSDLLSGTLSTYYSGKPSLEAFAFDIFNYAITFTNYCLLASILWILFCVFLTIEDLSQIRHKIWDSIDIFCPDRIGGFYPLKSYLFEVLYLFLISTALIIATDPFFLINISQHIREIVENNGVFKSLFSIPSAEEYSVIAVNLYNLAYLATLSLVGGIFTAKGLNRLRSISLKGIEDRIRCINDQYSSFQKKLLDLTSEDRNLQPEEISFLKTTLDTLSNEREKLLQWYFQCGGIRFRTIIQLVVAYIPPLFAAAAQLLVLLLNLNPE